MLRGEIWTVVPLQHPKPRRALVLSADAWNRYAPDVVLIPLTTQPGPSRPTVRGKGLRRASYAKCGAISAIPKERLGKRIGLADADSMAAVAAEVRRLLAI